MKYRKRPVEVEALQIHGNVSEIKEFIGKNGDVYIYDAAWKAGADCPHTAVIIHTLEGDMRAADGDYIIKGVKGEFYPCRKDIFEETYEPLTEKDHDKDLCDSCETKGCILQTGIIRSHCDFYTQKNAESEVENGFI